MLKVDNYITSSSIYDYSSMRVLNHNTQEMAKDGLYVYEGKLEEIAKKMESRSDEQLGYKLSKL